MKVLQISAVSAALIALKSTSSMGAVLREKTKNGVEEKGFFGDLAKGVAAGALGVPMTGMHQPPVGRHPDMAKADELEAHQKILEKKLQNELDALDKMRSEVNYMKDEGLLEKPQGIKALQGKPTTSEALKALAAGAPSPIGGSLEEYEAPIIFLEPPPISPKQMLEASESAQATLQRAGDESSPTMRALKEYERKKLGAVEAHTLDETRQEIRETESMIKKRKVEREELVDKLKQKGRQMAKTRSKRLKKEAVFANQDLKEKDKELDILANKLVVLKKKETNLIKMNGAGKEAVEEAEEEEEEEEDLEE